MKKILIIQGHPDQESYNFALEEAYKKGLSKTDALLETIHIRDLEFNPNLQFGYRKRTELEPDLLASWKKIQWADHIVLFHPVWWGSIPAMLKGFFDRLFLPRFAFQKREGSIWWDKLLKGRTGHIISTLDQPSWYYRFINFRPSYHAVKRQTFHFVGIRPVKTTTIGPLRLSKDSYRKKWLVKMEAMGREMK